ncbi:MAG: glycosyltransferase family 4 protein [Flavobacterium sp.]
MVNQIAILCNYRLLPERVGGMDVFFWELDKQAKKEGINITWFFPNSTLHGDYHLMDIKFNESTSVEETFLKYNQTFEVVVTHFVEIATPFFKIIKKKQLTSYTIVVDHNPRPINGYPIKKRISKKVKGFLFGKYIDRFIGVSAYTANELINDFGFHIQKKVKVIYNGVLYRSILFKKKLKYKVPKFIVVSHLRPSKGIQDLIKSVDLLPIELKKLLKIDIYGEGDFKQELINQIRILKLEYVFTFKGSISNIHELYYNYDYLLQPTHMECFSLSILESLAANVPVVTTPVGGNLEVVKDKLNGFIFPAKDFVKLAEVLENILSHKWKIEIETRKLIEDNFSINQMVSNHLNIIKNLK